MFKQKGGGVKGFLNKKLHFSCMKASLIVKSNLSLLRDMDFLNK